MESDYGTSLAKGAADWAGSATKYQYVGPGGQSHAEEVEWKGHAAAVRRFIQDLQQVEPIALQDTSALSAVGHRIVHGGPFTSSVRITPELRSQIVGLAELAPLHNPPSLAALTAAEDALPDLPHIAVFDTAFHATLPPDAYTYPIPQNWTREWGIRRFGFHGLSHAYCSRRAAEMLGRSGDAGFRLVICHLGHGCSASAVRGGRCVDTTMGFTPLEGLMMGTRSGSIDPAIVTHVQEKHHLSAEQVEAALNRESGLLGVSGVSSDMRQVLAAAKEGHADARLAISIYVRRVRQAIAALAASLGGIDALVFTAGVGENSAEMRAAVSADLDWLGIAIDPAKNAARPRDADIASGESRGRILVIATREDVTMFREVKHVLGPSSSEP
jgi:acetate kinase